MTAPLVESAGGVAQRTIRRVSWRLMPFLLLLYVVAFLDRANVSFASLQMKGDLGFTDSVIGMGAGLFFIGYFLFEVPGTILVESWSARRWFARIMISWGFCAAACGLIHTQTTFYGLRLLLGAFEAGFAPGIVVYLTHWFLHRDRGRALALFLIGIPLSGVVGGPISGLLLKVHWLGLAGWRWVFIIEGLPAVLLGVITLFYLTDWPREARWLQADERAWLQAELAHEEPTHAGPPGFRAALAGMGNMLPGVLASTPVLLLMAIYFFSVTTMYGLTIWMPRLLKEAGHLSDQHAATLTAGPYLVALIVMLLAGHSSDHRNERRWHTLLPVWFSALGLLGTILFLGQLWPLLLALCLATAGVCAFIPTFWALTTSRVAGRRGAVAVGLINSTGNLGGFVGPYVMGYLKDHTGTYIAGLSYLIAAALIAGALVLGVNLKRLGEVR